MRLQGFLGPRLFTLVALAIGMEGSASACVADESDAPRAAPSYESDIRPLFQAKCARCHGAKAPKADLDLTTPTGLRRGGESGPVIVNGKPEDSPLFEKIHSGAMPPNKNDRLSSAQVELIRRWIASGAQSGGSDVAPTAVTPTQHDVLPILLRRCAACHGARRQEAGLDVRTKSALLRSGKSGPAIVSGQPDASLLLAKIRTGAMPPRSKLVEAAVKPMEPAEIDVLARWVAAGSPEVAVMPDVASTTPDPLVSEEDRAFWAFRPPTEVVVPAVQRTEGIRNPIDAFILASLERVGQTLAPEADPLTLLRRACFDLTGLPPEPADAQIYLNDHGPQSYERLIDRLLASPRYGARWGRYWLDLAGYADSEGKREQDLPRPHAWRYRDYVIRAFNADKPYDRFLLEQLAGDELAEWQQAPTITAEIYDNLVATGFLRMAPDGTWANITGLLADRVEVIADEMDVLGSGVMGLTLKCARCHSHKFDPIPHRDYYRMVDIFKGAYDEHDWLKPDVKPGLGPVSADVVGGRHVPHVTTAERRSWEALEQRLQKEMEVARATLDKQAAEIRVKALQAQRLPEPRIQALWDRGEPSPTYIYRRGDPLQLGKLVGPGVPSVLTDGRTPFVVTPPWPGAKSTGRRLAFARWLTQPEHPLTARVVVNRVWKHHFGAGIVRTLGNFGKAGAPPTHPELLDWLAREFVRSGWSMKSLHRLMMTSATYRQTSAVTGVMAQRDPENRRLARMPFTRLDAEALYDTLLLIAGRLDESRFGPADAIQARADGLVTPTGTERGWRRLIYVKQARKQLPTHLENFDFPQMNPNCLERRDSTVVSQALHLLNNGMVHELAAHFARRIEREAGTAPERQVERAYWIALSRAPRAEETAVGVSVLRRLAEQWRESQGDGKRDPQAAHRQALTTYCHTLMNSAAFIYVD